MKWRQAYADGTDKQNREVKKYKRSLWTIDNLVEDKRKAPEKKVLVSPSLSLAVLKYGTAECDVMICFISIIFKSLRQL